MATIIPPLAPRIETRRIDIYSGTPEKPDVMIFYRNEYGYLELQNEYHMPWPKFVFDYDSKKVVGVQLSDGEVGELTEYHEKVCDSWDLEHYNNMETIDFIHTEIEYTLQIPGAEPND